MDRENERSGRFLIGAGPEIRVRWWTSEPRPDRYSSDASSRNPGAVQERSTQQIDLVPVDENDAEWLEGAVGVLEQGAERIRGELVRHGRRFTLCRKS